MELFRPTDGSEVKYWVGGEDSSEPGCEDPGDCWWYPNAEIFRWFCNGLDICGGQTCNGWLPGEPGELDDGGDCVNNGHEESLLLVLNGRDAQQNPIGDGEADNILLASPTDGFPFMHLGARYYDPAFGRFIQRDPIGFSSGLNVYECVDSYPQRLVDPSGLAGSWEGPRLPPG